METVILYNIEKSDATDVKTKYKGTAQSYNQFCFVEGNVK